MITCDEIIEPYEEDVEAKSHDETNFNKKKGTCKMQNLYFLLVFFLLL